MCGLCIYRGDVLGSDYGGNAFVCESLTNLVTRRVLDPHGTTFVSRRSSQESDKEFLASGDHWFHPVNLATGPDGALYLADFYREFVEHPIYVADQKLRAEIDWRKGFECGRLWRITNKSRRTNATPQPPRLSRASAAELVALLAHPVGWRRDTAQRLIVERQSQIAVPLLQQQLRQSRSSLGRSHALWTLSGLNALTEQDLLVAFADPDPELRRQALRAISRPAFQNPSVVKSVVGMKRDKDPSVRFQLALSARQLPSNEANRLLTGLLDEEPSREMQFAVLCSSSAAPSWAILGNLLANEAWRKSPTAWQITILEQLAEQLAVRPSNQANLCVDWLQQQAPSSVTQQHSPF